MQAHVFSFENISSAFIKAGREHLKFTEAEALKIIGALKFFERKLILAWSRKEDRDLGGGSYDAGLEKSGWPLKKST